MDKREWYVEFQNFTRQKIFFEPLAKKIKEILEKEKAPSGEISVCFVGIKRIKKINNDFRKKNKPTDVLTFAQLEDESLPFWVGQIIVCPQWIKKCLKTKKAVIFQKELTKVLIHSTLHLLGYDHTQSKRAAELMKTKEEFYLTLL
ncbi:MAG: rRNA maturation RNase YbeY [Minisyncoccales bacterium]